MPHPCTPRQGLPQTPKLCLPKLRTQFRSRSWPPSTCVNENTLRLVASATATRRDRNQWDRWSVFADRIWEFLCYDLIIVYLLAHKPGVRMKRVHIHAICHLSLMVVAAGFALYWLQSVLLPIILAAGMAVVLEPLVFLMIDPWVRMFGERPGVQAVFNENGEVEVQLSPQGIRRSESPIQFSEGVSDLRFSPDCMTGNQVSNVLRSLWCVFVVTFALFSLICCMAAVGYWIVSNIQAVNWSKYLEGEKMEWIKKTLAKHGVDDFEKAVRDAVAFIINTIGIQLVGSTLAALTGFLLMILFLGFFLIDSASDRSVSKEPWRAFEKKIMQQVTQRVPVRNSGASNRGYYDSVLMVRDDFLRLADTLMNKLRIQMRIYIKAKFWLSVVKSIMIGAVLAMLDVDLWPVWTLLTFVLNFMPLGSAISTFAPVPFIFLDPAKDFLVVCICVCWPLLVHNFVGNVVEPKVFANSLNLHPVTVLMALTFWTALWGVLGAIVCVPITAMIRVSLSEASDHPYTTPIVQLMEGHVPVPRSSGSKQFSLLLATTAHGAQTY